MRSMVLYFASRHTLANVFTLMMILLGLGTLTHIQRDEFPSVDLAEMVITTRYPGASPQDVELNVTNEIEEELKEVDGLKRVTSFSMENISVVEVKIDLDAKDLDKVKTDIRDAVSRTSDFPPEVDEAPVVREITTAKAIPIVEVGLSGDVPYSELREYARRTEKALEEIPGVSRLSRFGYRDREIHVEVLQDVLEKWQLPSAQIVNAIVNRNIRSSGGSFESYTNEKNIVTLAQFETPDEVGGVIVDVTGDGTQVRVGDLAIVKDTFEPEKLRSRMNGRAAISFLVYKKETADIIRTVERVKALVEKNQHRLPQGVRIEYSNDVSQNVSNRLGVVMSNGALGLILVFITLAIFLDLRTAVWVAMSIPVALFGTIFLLPMFGAYLDSIALGAMILVIGIIVDDSIIVAENIWRHREQGLSAIDAAVEGTSAVFRPVVTTLATTGLAFAPMFFMTGTLGDFIYVIPLVVILALLVSLCELTVALPAHLIWGVDESKSSSINELKKEQKQFNFDSIKHEFGSFLENLLRWRYSVITGAIIILAATFWYAERYIDFVLFPTQSADRFYVLAELPVGASLDSSSDAMRKLETLVEGLPTGEVESYVTRIGSHGNFSRGENEHWAYIGVFLTPYATRERNADMIVENLRKQGGTIDEIKRMVFVIDSGGPPVGRPITIRAVGSDDDQRSELAALVVQRLKGINGVKDIDRDDKRGKEQISIDIDYIRLAESALTVSDVARNVRLAFDGEIVTSVRYGDEDVDFRVLLEERARSSLETLADLVIPNARGEFIRLDEVAEFHLEEGPANIYHFDNERAITITADVSKELTTPLAATKEAVEGINIDADWPGMRLVVGGEAEESADSMSSLVVAFIAAAVGIYLLLLLLFDSTTQPMLVMIAIPFGLVGVIIAFAFHGQSFGFLAMLGAVGLTGIVVNDSLILVNLVNRLGKTGSVFNAHERIVEASRTRLRPIVLTSITTVVGLLPMAYGLGGSDPFSAPMALAMGYGILFATPITLILVPCLLAVLDDLHQFSRRFLDRDTIQD